MIKVTNYKIKQKSNGETFVTLELTGNLEMVQSQQTGKFYATLRKCSIPSTLDEETAEGIVGTKMEGSIVKQECEPYSYTIQSTGEVITLNYSYQYQPVSFASASLMSGDLVEA